MAKTLELSFQNEAGKTSRIQIADPKENLTPEEVQPVMDLVVAKNIFSTSGGDIVKALGARIIIRDAVEIISAG
ncbi:Protein of unknown function [Caldanaerovirga acetigignens]|uniref:DUF2922 domain-containing protein n=1 Tax=Caldanaerovirga acetigignens TaxID=447595 RepID=A0A1M7IMZ9_9FIRM|nr:DUF2922 domain-containing protein [Caldanaerovirga acetigignens]SHM41983.1 Protein of unknown function [Caldanaerovirga acetigignens]